VPEYIDEVIQALIEREIPFVRSFLLVGPVTFFMFSLIQILCHASPLAEVPEGIASNINASRLGFLAPWVPQQYILNHPVWSLGSLYEEF